MFQSSCWGRGQKKQLQGLKKVVQSLIKQLSWIGNGPSGVLVLRLPKFVWAISHWTVAASWAHLSEHKWDSFLGLLCSSWTGQWPGQMFLPRSDQELVVWKSSSGGDTFLVAKVPLQESPIQFQSWQLPCSLSSSDGSTVLPNQPYGHGTLAMVLAAQFPPGPSMLSNPTVLAFSVILRALLLRFRTQFQSVCMCVGGWFPYIQHQAVFGY